MQSNLDMRPIRYEELSSTLNRRQFVKTYTKVVGKYWIPKSCEEDPVIISDALLKRFPKGVIRGFTALLLWNYRLLDDQWVPEVTVPSDSSNPTTYLGRIRRRKLPEVHLVKGRRCVSVAQAIKDVLPGLKFEQQIALLDHLSRQDSKLKAILHDDEQLKKLVKWVNVDAESRPESLLRVRLIQEGFHDLVPQVEVKCGRRSRFVDLGDPLRRVGLEYQGSGHFDTAEKRAADSDRQNELRAAGWVLIEITWRDLQENTRWKGVVTRLAELLAEAERDRRRKLARN